MGHIIGHGRVSPTEGKIAAVKSFTVPRTKKQVRQFLGLTGYYRWFVDKYAEHSYLLTEATKKSAPERILWNDCLNAEFCYLKNALCVIPTFTLPLLSDCFVLQMDASQVGLGAVLSVQRDGEELPVTFYSRKLQPRERRYSATELEGLAVVASVHHFDAYLITHPITIETDHKALVFLNSAQHSNSRLARWAMRLQPYTFEIRYRPGGENDNVDALSRLFEEETPPLLRPLVKSARGGGGGRC